MSFGPHYLDQCISTTVSGLIPFNVSWQIMRTYFKLNTYTQSAGCSNLEFEHSGMLCLTFPASLHFWGWNAHTAHTLSHPIRGNDKNDGVQTTDNLMQTPNHIKAQLFSHSDSIIFGLGDNVICEQKTQLTDLFWHQTQNPQNENPVSYPGHRVTYTDFNLPSIE